MNKVHPTNQSIAHFLKGSMFVPNVEDAFVEGLDLHLESDTIDQAFVAKCDELRDFTLKVHSSVMSEMEGTKSYTFKLFTDHATGEKLTEPLVYEPMFKDHKNIRIWYRNIPVDSTYAIPDRGITSVNQMDMLGEYGPHKAYYYVLVHELCHIIGAQLPFNSTRNAQVNEILATEYAFRVLLKYGGIDLLREIQIHDKFNPDAPLPTEQTPSHIDCEGHPDDRWEWALLKEILSAFLNEVAK